MKNIIFDFGGVLIDWDPRLVYKPYFGHDDAAVKRFFDETDIMSANHAMDKGQPFGEALSELAANHPHYREPIFYWKDKWLDMVRGPIEGTVKILRELHDRGYPLYGLTNWSHETFPLVFKQNDFFCCFRDIVVSGVEKEIKPEPEIFHILLRRNQLQPETCLFIDDNASNIETAKKLGMAGILFESPKQLIEELKKNGIPYEHEIKRGV